MKKEIIPRMVRSPAAAPMPIPAFAPVLRLDNDLPGGVTCSVEELVAVIVVLNPCSVEELVAVIVVLNPFVE